MCDLPGNDAERTGRNAPRPSSCARVTPRPWHLALAAPALLAACRDDDEGLVLPSGLQVSLVETLTEPQPYSEEVWVVLRVLAPDLAGQQISAEERAADTDALCAEWGVPVASEAPEPPDQIVIQMMSETVERGRAAPGVTQVFAGYRFQNGLCIWEDF